MVLDTKLDFNLHQQKVQSKVNKTLGLLGKLQNILPRESLIAIYQSFIRSHLDYGDLIYYGVYNSSFHQSSKLIQYNIVLAVTGVIRETSKEKISRLSFWISATKMSVQRTLLIIQINQK